MIGWGWCNTGWNGELWLAESRQAPERVTQCLEPGAALLPAPRPRPELSACQPPSVTRLQRNNGRLQSEPSYEPPWTKWAASKVFLGKFLYWLLYTTQHGFAVFRLSDCKKLWTLAIWFSPSSSHALTVFCRSYNHVTCDTYFLCF